MSDCRRTLQSEGHNAAGWGTSGQPAQRTATAGPKSVRSGNGRPLIAPRRLLLMLVQYATSNCKPLLFWFPCKWRYINVGTFNLSPLSWNKFIATSGPTFLSLSLSATSIFFKKCSNFLDSKTSSSCLISSHISTGNGMQKRQFPSHHKNYDNAVRLSDSDFP